MKKKVKEKTWCPGCELPRPGYTAKVCPMCSIHMQTDQQVQVRVLDGRTLNLGGKIRRRPGCE